MIVIEDGSSKIVSITSITINSFFLLKFSEFFLVCLYHLNLISLFVFTLQILYVLYFYFRAFFLS